ncbi:MAG: hypothetical protein M3N18_00735 [Actinomycetota bacterium]|nr:hypothetical protein [Actinomycetota bacterium]
MLVEAALPSGVHARQGSCFAEGIKRAERANLLEEVDESGSVPAVEGSTLRVEVRPFEVLILRLEL